MSSVYCTGCNNTDQDVVSLLHHPNRLDKMFKAVIGFQVSEDTHLCDECASKLRLAYNFKTQCLAVLKLYDLELLPENQTQTFFMHSPVQKTPINICSAGPMKAEDIIFEEETLSEEEVDQFQGEEMESIYVAQQPESVCASEKELDMSDDLEEAAETGEFLDNSDIPEDDRVHSEPIEADLKETYKLVNQPKKEGKQRRSFTTAVKLQLVEYAEKHGNYQTGRDFNLSEASVRGWRKQKALLLTSDKGTRKAFRKGAPHWPQLEVKLRSWLMYENSRQNLICDDDIKVKSLQIAKESGIVNFICSRRWFEAFKNRSGLIKAKISEENDMVEIVEIEEVPDMPEKPRTFKKTRYWHKQNDELDTKGQFILDHGFAEECLVDLH